jgi:hypothetical protein
MSVLEQIVMDFLPMREYFPCLQACARASEYPSGCRFTKSAGDFSSPAIGIFPGVIAPLHRLGRIVPEMPFQKVWRGDILKWRYRG